MADNKPVRTQTESDEIDLGQLMRMIGRGFNNLFRSFLGFFNYLKKNILIFAGLILIGVVIAVILNNLTPKMLKTEIIVKPNFDSTDYLYDVVEEVKSKISVGDTVFFRGIGIAEPVKLRLEIEPIESKQDDENQEDNLKYLQLLKDFPNEAYIQDVLKTEILKKSVLNHRITFFYENAEIGSLQAKKLMKYLNGNEYFNELKEIYTNNALAKIQANNQLIVQIDDLISGFSKSLAKDGKNLNEGTVVLDNENGLDIPTLLSLKNSLLKENERKKLEILQQKEVIKVVNFGQSQSAEGSFFGNRIVVYPLIMIGFFLLYSLLAFLNRKSKEIY